jgi:hypothetical protein
LHFEIFPDHSTSGFPVRAFFLDRTSTEYFIEADDGPAYPSPVDPGLLEIAALYPTEVEERAELASADLDVWEVASEEIAISLLGCWRAAGGEGFSLHATVGPHDSSWEIDLRSGIRRPAGSLFR